ncbi:MAG: proteasome-type protease [Candidatus Protistobacter heckmanni]|nr:proteasome-type protease [Candidatus Protistobacter heckmanni]
MTYCCGLCLDAGLVFLSDSRTNAGVDAISTFRKVTVFENPGDRVLVPQTSGNLAISQSVRQLLMNPDDAKRSLWHAKTMFEAARMVGDAVRQVHARDAETLKQLGIEFNVSLIFGGQIKGEAPRMFNVYSAGNFIETTPENCYFQIGEAKYGKPILDRVLRGATPLDEAVKSALISMDSTLKSNISVGLPLDLLVYETDALKLTHFVSIDEKNEYFAMVRGLWASKLRQAFAEIRDPVWETGAGSVDGLKTLGASALPLVAVTPPLPRG